MTAAPLLSVLIPAYNAQPYIGQALQSVLSQSFADFEIVVVDDASTDATAEIASSVGDSRLRLFRNPKNLGVVGARNRGLAECRGQFIANLDADDYCLPHRFERQVRFLCKNPNTLMVGASGYILAGQKLSSSALRPEPDPIVLRWLFHVTNPIGNSSMMFHRGAAEKLGSFLREDLKYAEDFDFSHRLLVLGPIAMLADPLVVYRRVEHGVSRRNSDMVTKRVAAVLSRQYREALGTAADAAAEAVASHIMANRPMRSDAQFTFLGTVLDSLAEAFLRQHHVTSQQHERILARTAELWWRVVTGSLRAGAVSAATRGFRSFRHYDRSVPPTLQIGKSALRGLAAKCGYAG